MKELTLLFPLKGDAVLLAMKKRGLGEGKWNGVGGKLEPGETVKQAVIRETEEEINITPKTFTSVGQIVFKEFHSGEMLVHVFVCSDWEGTVAESEEMKPVWFKQSEIPYAKMWSDDKYWLPIVLGG